MTMKKFSSSIVRRHSNRIRESWVRLLVGCCGATAFIIFSLMVARADVNDTSSDTASPRDGRDEMRAYVLPDVRVLREERAAELDRLVNVVEAAKLDRDEERVRRAFALLGVLRAVEKMEFLIDQLEYQPEVDWSIKNSDRAGLYSGGKGAPAARALVECGPVVVHPLLTALAEGRVDTAYARRGVGMILVTLLGKEGSLERLEQFAASLDEEERARLYTRDVMMFLE